MEIAFSFDFLARSIRSNCNRYIVKGIYYYYYFFFIAVVLPGIERIKARVRIPTEDENIFTADSR